MAGDASSIVPDPLGSSSQHLDLLRVIVFSLFDGPIMRQLMATACHSEIASVLQSLDSLSRAPRKDVQLKRSGVNLPHQSAFQRGARPERSHRKVRSAHYGAFRLRKPSPGASLDEQLKNNLVCSPCDLFKLNHGSEMARKIFKHLSNDGAAKSSHL